MDTTGERKIVLISNEHNWTYNLRKELISALLEKKYSVTLIFPYGDRAEVFKSMGCGYVDVPMFQRRGKNPFKDIRLMIKYYVTLKKLRPDAVLTYTIKPNLYGGLAAGLLGIPYLSNVTGLGTSIENEGVMKKLTLALYKIGLKKARMIFFQNRENCKFMREQGIVQNNYRILPGSGVNLTENCYEEYPSEEDGIRFLFVGRIMKDKGIEEYLSCAGTIHERCPACKFDIVGDYDDEQYRDRIEEYEKQGIVKAYGHQKDVHSIMKNHHVLIQPSYHEGMSNVLLEAAACGRPVLASNIPGCMETFDDGTSGFGFTARSGDSLVAAVEKLLALSSEDRKNMGIHGREKVEKEFDRKIIVDAYLSELEALFAE